MVIGGIDGRRGGWLEVGDGGGGKGEGCVPGGVGDPQNVSTRPAVWG